MRLKKHFSTLLVERNIGNISAVESFIEGLARRSKQDRRHGPHVQRWIKTVLRKWLINDYENVRLADDSTRGLDKFAYKKIENGEEIYKIEFDNEFQNEMLHLGDWLNAEPPRDVTRVSVPDARRNAGDWVRRLAKKGAGQEGYEGTTMVAPLGPGFALYRLETMEACEWEGSKMGHCIGGYDPANYSKGKISGLYSIRDKNGPHVTIEIDNYDNIIQVQGKENKFPKPKYMEQVDIARNGPLKKAAAPEEWVRLANGTERPMTEIESGDVIEYLAVDGDLHESLTIPEGVKVGEIALLGDDAELDTKDGVVIDLLSVEESNSIELKGTTVNNAVFSKDSLQEFSMDGCMFKQELRFEAGPWATFKNTTFGKGISVKMGGTLEMHDCKVNGNIYADTKQGTSFSLVGTTAKKIEVVNSTQDTLEVMRCKVDDVKFVNCHLYDQAVDLDGTAARSLTLAKCHSTEKGHCYVDAGRTKDVLIDSPRLPNAYIELLGTVDTLTVKPPKDWKKDRPLVKLGRGCKVKKVIAPEGSVSKG